MKRLAVGLALIGAASAPLLSPTVMNALEKVGGQVTSAAQPTPFEAARFLTQATFGPTDSSIADVQSQGYAAWIDQQEAMPVSGSHQAFVETRLAELKLIKPSYLLLPGDFYASFWMQAATGPDQLRQRVKLALSEIFVLSFQAPQMDIRGVASYYDVLGQNAFGNYRTLLEKVTLHPMMANYLTYIANVKENPATGEHPDENYAREIQQLMSIGLYKLNQDGSVQTDGAGAPIPNYTIADIQGLAKVFTGFSYYSPNPTSSNITSTFYGGHRDPNTTVTPMIAYPSLHSTSQKDFLGTTIPASAAPDPEGDLKIALDTIFNNPSVGPFISKQLIQRLVTSNPSPAYVSRVAAVFNDNGSGVRGDLGAVIKAILLDDEARNAAGLTSPTFGKLREPVVRIANWARAFNATSHSGEWTIQDTSQPVALDQSVLNSPSVFNFWRPGYSPPGSAMGGQGLVAPEFQVVDAVTTAGYINLVQKMVGTGIGTPPAGSSIPDVTAAYGSETPLAANPAQLADRVNLMLLYGQMSPGLKTRIVSALNAIAFPKNATQTQIDGVLSNRAKMAVFMTLASPEYLAQR